MNGFRLGRDHGQVTGELATLPEIARRPGGPIDG
jgi:hypothetical protein